jgi:multidrug efflux system outer membrane protein
VDLFGRVRSLREQALEKYVSTIEAQRSAQLTLVAQIATQYLTVREAEELLQLTQDTLAAVQKSYDLNKVKFDAGSLNELDLRTAEAQVQTAKYNVATYEQQVAQAENYLVLLIGAPFPADLPAGRPLASQNLLASLKPGLPSDLLMRRPDILEAEHTLKAANADIGAARAAFFPKITLTASGGASSLSLSRLFEGVNGVWSYTPDITIPIFDGGNNLANLDLAKIQKRIEIANYESAIQTAFREVADGLAGRHTINQQLDALVGLVAAEQKRYELSTDRYRNGADTYLNVLSAQQDLYSAQQSLIQTRFTRLSNLISLYKALGGGWK